MFNNGNGQGASVADIAALMGGNGMNNGFWGGDGFWAIIILAFLFGGFGGWGGNWGGNNSSGAQAGFYATQADLQRGFDQAALSNKIDSLQLSMQNNIQDPGYMISNSFAQAELSRANNQAAILAQMNNLAMMEMQDTNATQAMVSGAANQAQANTAQLRYDMATSDCAIKTAIAQAVTDINANNNANYRQLHDEMIADKIAALNETIRRQDSQINGLQLAASQAAQNNYLIDQLRPAAVPAYQVPNPYYGYGFQCGCNTSCCN